jgi:hypothetical protein
LVNADERFERSRTEVSEGVGKTGEGNHWGSGDEGKQVLCLHLFPIWCPYQIRVYGSCCTYMKYEVVKYPILGPNYENTTLFAPDQSVAGCFLWPTFWMGSINNFFSNYFWMSLIQKKISTMTADEYFEKHPELKKKFDDEIRNDFWGY